MWSLGVIVLETVIGFPVWMSYKGRIVKGNRSSLNLMTGTFGVQGRVPSKIAKIQQNVSSNIPKFFSKKEFNDGLCLGNVHKNAEFLDLLQLMLNAKPRLRKDPDSLLTHPFLQYE